MEHILIACGKQEIKTSEALSLTISPFLLNITPVRKLWIPHDVTSAILVSQTITRRPYWCPKPVLWHVNERKVGVVVRALTSHQCGPGLDHGVDIICGLSLLLVLTPQKTTLPNSNSIWNVRTQFNEFSRTQFKKKIYAFFFTNMFWIWLLVTWVKTLHKPLETE